MNIMNYRYVKCYSRWNAPCISTSSSWVSMIVPASVWTVSDKGMIKNYFWKYCMQVKIMSIVNVMNYRSVKCYSQWNAPHFSTSSSWVSMSVPALVWTLSDKRMIKNYFWKYCMQVKIMNVVNIMNLLRKMLLTVNCISIVCLLLLVQHDCPCFSVDSLWQRNEIYLWKYCI